MISLSVFLISFFLMFVLLMIKTLEQNLHRKTFVSNFLSKGDAHLFRMKVRAEHVVHENKQKTIFFFLFHLPERIEIFFGGLKKKAHDRYYHMSSRVRGKQTLDSSADVSPFIRNIGPTESDRN